MDNDTPQVASAPPLQTQEHILSQGYALMPLMVVFDESLSNGAKLLYCYLNALAASNGTCYPKNKHLADRFGVSKRQIINWMNELMDGNYVLQANDEDGSSSRNLLLYERGGVKKTSPGGENNFTGGVKKTSPITDANNIKVNSKTNKEDSARPELDRLYTLYILRMKLDPHLLATAPDDNAKRALLETAKNNYRLTPKRRDKIASRLKDCGYDMCAKATINIGKSEFHKGGNDRKWFAHLEWLYNSVEKIEEWANKEDQNG